MVIVRPYTLLTVWGSHSTTIHFVNCMGQSYVRPNILLTVWGSHSTTIHFVTVWGSHMYDHVYILLTVWGSHNKLCTTIHFVNFMGQSYEQPNTSLAVWNSLCPTINFVNSTGQSYMYDHTLFNCMGQLYVGLYFVVTCMGESSQCYSGPIQANLYEDIRLLTLMTTLPLREMRTSKIIEWKYSKFLKS